MAQSARIIGLFYDVKTVKQRFFIASY